MAPIEKYGVLSIQGAHLVDQWGNPVQLKGMSSHGLAWFPQLYNKQMLKFIHEDWKCELFRCAMYTAEYGGYTSNRDIKYKVYEMVDAAIELGMYVIVDWHILSDGNPMIHANEAVEFFDEVVSKYGDCPNILYELCNEPNGWGQEWPNIKAYAERVIPVIRAKAPNAICIVGSGNWSQDIHLPAQDPLQFPNVAYTLHFYAGTHGSWLRDRISYVMGLGHAVFVTEWGMTQASGTGGVYYHETSEWLQFLKDKKVSWANWSIANKDEDSAALRSWASSQGGWDDNALSESGRFVRDYLKNNA